ncbi:MAG: helicase [Betaproteobacteria bacterium HGW-Betaproteobacteria-8]|nr:MAG: helicase [Betaproteobacteria bacterium HGW-Betaproteobacteria-8]
MVSRVKNLSQRAANALALENFPATYALARSLQRQIHFKIGPTNSGKTHDALMALQQAKSGVYLAPLRLLAMEIRDRLTEAGVPCNLVTGEERVMVAGARHTASTVEMMNPHQEVEVAVIDEIQMLQDEHRGHAWTAAIVGAPAKEIYLCGSHAVMNACTRLLDALHEPYNISHLERKTPLLLEELALCGDRYNRWRLKGKLQKGDAVIAFTRKDVLTLSARIRQWGFGVATIYGALSPEVRRTEARRFNSGEADILVATDAIGMGLNLPIRRVIFSTVEKFDGIANRLLNPTEARQIAGRAGRYGIYPTGFVNAFEQDELLHLEHALYASDISGLERLPISPFFGHIDVLSGMLHTDRLGELLTFFAERVTVKSSLFQTADMSAHIQLGAWIDLQAPELSLRDKFIMSCAPVSLDRPHESDYFLACLQSVRNGKARRLPPEYDWLSSSSPKHLQEAEDLSQDISLYAWLAGKFPQIFIENENLPVLRNKVSRYIERALLTQAGYGSTSKELLYQY